MAEITFANPSYLWVLILVPFIIAIHFFTLRQAKTDVIKFSNFEALERVAVGNVLGKPYKGLLRNKNVGLLALRALVYCLLIFSAAGTTIWYKGNTSNYDYVLAIDTSSSMLADDFEPSRLDAAKDAAIKFVELVPSGASIGIVTFASTSIAGLRPTSNLEEVKEFIDTIDLQQSGGTAIGDAIVTASNLFDSKKPKTIILITDGQNNVGVDLDVAMEYAKRNGIIVHAVGVATKEGGNVSSLNIISKLDEGLLKKVAQETNGGFFVAGNAQSLRDIFKLIATSSEKLISINISWLLLVTAIIVLGLEWILLNIIYKSSP